VFPVEIVELPSQQFRPRVYGLGAWTDNLHFAYDAVAALRPKLLVELGTDRGESYFSFCQSVAENRTATRCFAVDTWRGDEHAGGYDETTFAEVSEHNAAHYAEFSTLLRCTFDEALDQFAPDTIDLLHLDGLHTEAAVRHDVESWLPKIRPGGILLMHDISVRTRQFGVWKVWEELRTRGRSYAFTAGPGLGVWQKPPQAPLAEPLAALLGDSVESAAAVEAFYSRRARELQEQIGHQWRDGTIRNTAAARQTTVQVFHTNDGAHREEDSVVARVGHNDWKNVSLRLPPGAGAAPLRVDFFSALTMIDIARLTVTAGERTVFAATWGAEFNSIEVAGDAERLPHPWFMRLRITGMDPQLYLPPIRTSAADEPLMVNLRLRVVSGDAPGIERRKTKTRHASSDMPRSTVAVAGSS
jgi:hypothetical protein